MVWNVRHDHGIGADSGIGPDRHRTDDLCAGADEDMVAKPGTAAAIGANRDLVLDVDSRAAVHLAVDDDPVRWMRTKPGRTRRPAR